MKYFSLYTFLAVVLLTFTQGCSSKSSLVYVEADEAQRNTVDVGDNEKTLSLKDYLVRIPNLYWTNGRIMLRENSSINSQGEPLYILDGAQIGRSYSRAESAVDPNDIRSVKVLTSAAETSIYGIQGVNGVILIKTKKRN